MFLDARQISAGDCLETDLCIVGAGPAGISLAREFVSSPVRVCMLESGGLAVSRTAQSLCDGEITGQPYFPLHETRRRCFGGTTTVWSGECRALDPLDFEARAWIPDSGWPFPRAVLQSYYERARTVCGLAPDNRSPIRRLEDEWAPPAPEGAPFETGIFAYSAPIRFGRAYRGELRRAANVTVFLNATALRIETNGTASEVTSLEAADRHGSRFSVRARICVLAAGGIENARLLLLSNQVQPAGLGNAHDLVGRYFMEHLFFDDVAALALPDHAPDPRRYLRRRRVEGGTIKAVIAPSESLLRREHMLNLCIRLNAPSTTRIVRSLAGASRALVRGEGAGVAGMQIARASREAAMLGGRRTYRVGIVSEQAPTPHSRITLSHERDAFGQRRATLHWQLSELDRRSWRRALDLLAAELGRAGLGRLTPVQAASPGSPNGGPRGGRHHMGTTRMSDTPKRGVVDANGRVHGLSNLYVAGSSVFPTGGYANPTLTIVALTLRLADHLQARLRSG